MIYQDYKLPCKYNIGELEPKLWFINRARSNWIISNDDIRSADFPIGLNKPDIYFNCEDIRLSEETAFDNRYAFTYSLTVSLRENNITFNFLKELRENVWDYVLIVKSKGEETYWVLNPEFPYYLTYNCEWSNSNELYTLTFSMSENIPLTLNKEIPQWAWSINIEPCEYFKPFNDSFDVIEYKDFLGLNNNWIFLSNGIDGTNFKNIEPLKNTAVFTHSFDGEKFTDSVRFTISMERYQANFKYNILEFIKNKYLVKFKSSKNINYLMGLENGLFPSFSVESGEDNNLNTITITLSTVSNEEIYSTIEPIKVDWSDNSSYITVTTSDNKKPVQEFDFNGQTFDTLECISPTMAKRILLAYSYNGYEHGNAYVCHVDYQNRFQGLNIYGTYTDETYSQFNVKGLPLYVATDKCIDEYQGGGTPPTPPDTGQTAVTAMVQWFTLPDEYDCADDGDEEIDENAKYKWSETSDGTACDGVDKYGLIYLLKSVDNGTTWKKTSIWRYGELVEANTTDCGGDVPSTGETPTFTGDTNVIYKWEDGTDYICEGRNLHYVSYKWSSKDNGNTWKKTGETKVGKLVETDSSTCTAIYYRWVVSEGETECNEGNLYQILKEEKSFDNISWTTTGNKKRGEMIEEYSSECGVITRMNYLGEFCGSELDNFNIVNKK